MVRVNVRVRVRVGVRVRVRVTIKAKFFGGRDCFKIRVMACVTEFLGIRVDVMVPVKD